MFEEILGFNNTVEMMMITEDEIEFYDSVKENEKVREVDVLGVIVLAIIVLFILATLISTFILWSRAKQY